MVSRRIFSTLVLGAGFPFVRRARSAPATFEVQLSDAEWRRKLPAAQYAVLRKHDTERPFASPLLKEKHRGEFACAGCDLPLFSSDAKFESNTGWPSFWTTLPKAIGQQRDTSWGMTRVEVHCSRCGGHQGHLFEDGPQPTGLRYCINGLALKFVPA